MNVKCSNDEYLIIDWGTTNFRVFLMSNTGKLIKKKETSQGLLNLEQAKENEDKFAIALKRILASWLPYYQSLPIFMAGMVGSVNGWHCVDYVSTNSSISELINNKFSFKLPWGSIACIYPGISHFSQSKKYNDVMRGEEIQVFGLLKKCSQQSISAILPGTHSKHVTVNEGKICSISTFMTGELFAIVSQYSILGKDLPTQIFDQSTFIKGVLEGQTNQLPQVLFQARTHSLFNIIEQSHIKCYISGVLIGNELQGFAENSVYLVGGQTLCEKYHLACTALKISATYVNGDECFLSGMNTMIKKITSLKA